MDRKIKVIICKPEQAPEVCNISDDLKTLQGIVDGIIDIHYPCDHKDDTCIILNDEGKLEGLPANRVLTDNGEPYDVVVGTFIIVRAPEDSDEFESLTDEQVEKYMKMYAEPLEEVTPEVARLAEPRMGFVEIF